MYGKQCTSAATTTVLELPTWRQARPCGPSWAEVSPMGGKSAEHEEFALSQRQTTPGVEVAEAELRQEPW